MIGNFQHQVNTAHLLLSLGELVIGFATACLTFAMLVLNRKMNGHLEAHGVTRPKHRKKRSHG